MRHLLPLLPLLACATDDRSPDDPLSETDPAAQAAQFEPIEATLAASCATSGCHDGTQVPDMRPPSYDRLVGVWARQITLPYVDPEYLDTSYLFRKLDGSQAQVGGGGARMPLAGEITEAQIEEIAAWIEQGANP